MSSSLNAIQSLITSNGIGCSDAILSDTGCWINSDVASGADTSCILLLAVPEHLAQLRPTSSSSSSPFASLEVRITVYPAGTQSFPTSCLIFVAAPPRDSSRSGLSAQEVVVRDWSLDRKMVVSGMAAANGMSMSIPLQSLFNVANLIGSPQRTAASQNGPSPYHQQLGASEDSSSYPLVFLGLRFVGCTDLSGQHRIRKVKVELLGADSEVTHSAVDVDDVAPVLPKALQLMNNNNNNNNNNIHNINHSTPPMNQYQNSNNNNNKYGNWTVSNTADRALSLSPRDVSVSSSNNNRPHNNILTPPSSRNSGAPTMMMNYASQQNQPLLSTIPHIPQQNQGNENYNSNQNEHYYQQQQQQQYPPPPHPMTKTKFETQQQQQQQYQNNNNLPRRNSLVGQPGGGGVPSVPTSPDTSVIEVEIDKYGSTQNLMFPSSNNFNNNNSRNEQSHNNSSIPSIPYTEEGVVGFQQMQQQQQRIPQQNYYSIPQQNNNNNNAQSTSPNYYNNNGMDEQIVEIDEIENYQRQQEQQEGNAVISPQPIPPHGHHQQQQQQNQYSGRNFFDTVVTTSAQNMNDVVQAPSFTSSAALSPQNQQQQSRNIFFNNNNNGLDVDLSPLAGAPGSENASTRMETSKSKIDYYSSQQQQPPQPQQRISYDNSSQYWNAFKMMNGVSNNNQIGNNHYNGSNPPPAPPPPPPSAQPQYQLQMKQLSNFSPPRIEYEQQQQQLQQPQSKSQRFTGNTNLNPQQQQQQQFQQIIIPPSPKQPVTVQQQQVSPLPTTQQNTNTNNNEQEKEIHRRRSDNYHSVTLDRAHAMLSRVSEFKEDKQRRDREEGEGGGFIQRERSVSAQRQAPQALGNGYFLPAAPGEAKWKKEVSSVSHPQLQRQQRSQQRSDAVIEEEEEEEVSNVAPVSSSSLPFSPPQRQQQQQSSTNAQSSSGLQRMTEKLASIVSFEAHKQSLNKNQHQFNNSNNNNQHHHHQNRAFSPELPPSSPPPVFAGVRIEKENNNSNNNNNNQNSSRNTSFAGMITSPPQQRHSQVVSDNNYSRKEGHISKDDNNSNFHQQFLNNSRQIPSFLQQHFGVTSSAAPVHVATTANPSSNASNQQRTLLNNNSNNNSISNANTFVSLISNNNSNNNNNNRNSSSVMYQSLPQNFSENKYGNNNNIRSNSPSMPDVLMANHSNATGNEPLGFFKSMMQRPPPPPQQTAVTNTSLFSRRSESEIGASINQNHQHVNQSNTSEFLQLSRATNLGRSQSLVDEARELLSASRSSTSAAPPTNSMRTMMMKAPTSVPLQHEQQQQQAVSSSAPNNQFRSVNSLLQQNIHHDVQNLSFSSAAKLGQMVAVNNQHHHHSTSSQLPQQEQIDMMTIAPRGFQPSMINKRIPPSVPLPPKIHTKPRSFSPNTSVIETKNDNRSLNVSTWTKNNNSKPAGPSSPPPKSRPTSTGVSNAGGIPPNFIPTDRTQVTTSIVDRSPTFWRQEHSSVSREREEVEVEQQPQLQQQQSAATTNKLIRPSLVPGASAREYVDQPGNFGKTTVKSMYNQNNNTAATTKNNISKSISFYDGKSNIPPAPLLARRNENYESPAQENDSLKSLSPPRRSTSIGQNPYSAYLLNDSSSTSHQNQNQTQFSVPIWKHHVSKELFGEYLLTVLKSSSTTSDPTKNQLFLELIPKNENEMSPRSKMTNGVGRYGRSGSVPKPTSHVLTYGGVILKVQAAAMKDPSLHTSCIQSGDGNWCVVLREKVHPLSSSNGGNHNNHQLWAVVGGPLIFACEFTCGLDFRRFVDLITSVLGVKPTTVF